MAQILGYLPIDECVAFRELASSLSLDASGLANILIMRELARRRLPDLLNHDHSRKRKDCSKVTAHQSDGRTKQAFLNHSAQFNLKPSRAASLVFRAELKELSLRQWIGGGLRSSPSLTQIESLGNFFEVYP